MARSIRSAQLETRTTRLRLPVRGKPYNARVAKGLRLCYRRNKTDGTWNRLYKDELKFMALADDYQDADGVRVLSFDQAVSRCRLDVYGADESIENGDRPITFDAGITAYEADLAARGGGKKNATWLRARTPQHLLKKALSAMDAKDFRRWRDDLIAEGKLEPGTINRLLRASVFACCNNQRKLDPRIRDTWSIGWPVLPNARRERNVVISDLETRAVVRESYAISPEFGLYVEIAATTGARPSQIARLTCGDVQPDRMMMPVSRKGAAKRTIAHKPVPLPAKLAQRLRSTAKDQPADAPLLVQEGGKGPWTAGAHYQKFQIAAKAAGLDPAVVTFYALRHTYITSALLRGVPIRLVADVVDSSVMMLERSYSKYIAHHGDAMLRAGMLDLSAEPATDNVKCPMRRRGRGRGSTPSGTAARLTRSGSPSLSDELDATLIDCRVRPHTRKPGFSANELARQFDERYPATRRRAWRI